MKESAADCEFEADLEMRLRDQLVLGLNNQAIQEEMALFMEEVAAEVVEVELVVVVVEQQLLMKMRMGMM